MTDPTNPGGWPDATRPGWPLNPDKNGWHWLTTKNKNVLACFWSFAPGSWTTAVGDGALWPEQVDDWTYSGPCLTPAEIAAQVAAARAEERAEERDACVALALGRVACSDEREGYMCHRNWYEIAAAIRARGVA